jgi:hypothetical protein
MLRSLFGSKSRDTDLDDAFRARFGVEPTTKRGATWIVDGGVRPVLVTVEDGWVDLRVDGEPPAGDHTPVAFNVIWNVGEDDVATIEADTSEPNAAQLADQLRPLLEPLIPLGVISALAQEGSINLVLGRPTVPSDETAQQLVERISALVPVAAGLVGPVTDAFTSWARSSSTGA